ncbi:RCC1 and BTB domain-containing protein 1-like [Linepithema humile]|uniref:RCC1 and BTB domain-containing protein 1-like n=1 Tax=Linepithema humile TaxID=83485 RepID=UPI00351E8114
MSENFKTPAMDLLRKLLQKESPLTLPTESLKESSEESLRKSLRGTPKESPRGTPRESPRGTPRESQRETPRESQRETPRESPRESLTNNDTSRRALITSPSIKQLITYVEENLEFINDKDSVNHYLQSNDLKLWPLLSILRTNFLVQIELVMWYGNNNKPVNWKAVLIVTEDKNVYGVGSRNGQFILNDTISTLQPQKLEALCQQNIKTITGTAGSYFVLTEEGKVYSWGDNKFNTLGYDTSRLPPDTFDEMVNINNSWSITVNYPLEVTALSGERVVDIKCGYYHVLVLTDDKKVYSWGRNNRGQVGHAVVETVPIPTEVIIEDEWGKKDIQSISCGLVFNMAVTCDGELYGWGENTYGQLGLGINGAMIHLKPMKIMIDVPIAKVECGTDHTLALSREGLLYVWGKNDHGQLGIGNCVNYVFYPIPIDTREMGKITNIAARFDCSRSLAINKDERIYFWGAYKGKHYLNPSDVNLNNIEVAFIGSRSFMKIYCPCTNLIKLEKLSYVMSPEYLETAFNNSASADIELIVDRQSLYIHKIVIMLRCKEMYAQFFPYDTNNVIMRDDFSAASYKSFLKYLYTGVIDPSYENPLELYELATFYQHLIFRENCMEIIHKRINISNVMHFYGEAISLEIKSLEQFCFEYAMENLSAVVRTEAFAKLAEKVRLDFIIEAADALTLIC